MAGIGAEALAAWRAGRISAPVALARMVLANDVPPDLPPALALLLPPARAEALRAAAARLDHHGAADAAAIAAGFDAAVAAAPEASVAAWSLNDPALLARGTAELLAWLDSAGLIAPDRDVLDLGCGVGRVAAALAPRCRTVRGVDASPGMVAEARRRHAAPNLYFAVVPGTGLAGLPPADLFLAVDVMPYLVQAGVAERHVADAAHLLRPGGHLAVFNLSYRGAAFDAAAARRWAADYGFRLAVCGARPFALWDGSAFLFMRDTTASTATPNSAEISEPENTASFTSD